ncbi:MAG: nucleotide exchange factor GrpE [Nitrospirae bacterium RBG_13_39_12]|nr:MAG: nucleotide exchange factor GrpE [Nitrospirae bacterium RBG_13_39_12]
MQERRLKENQTISNEEEIEEKNSEVVEEFLDDEKVRLTAELKEINEKYLRLYAEFENYKKRVNKDKEELIKYGTESLLLELLPVIDNLELALKHASDKISEGLVQGVGITLKELRKTLEKFGLSEIEANGKPFDPLVHHAMNQVERDDVDEKTVVEELRKGYIFRDKVLRPSLVTVSKKPVVSEREEDSEKEIKINKIIEEES